MGKLKQKANAAGVNVEAYVPQIIEKEGGVRQASVFFDCEPYAIRNFLKSHGLQVITEKKVRVVKKAIPVAESRAPFVLMLVPGASRGFTTLDDALTAVAPFIAAAIKDGERVALQQHPDPTATSAPVRIGVKDAS